MESSQKDKVKIPVIDIFAGPGGLGEGFSTYCSKSDLYPFCSVLSIEKDAHAHSALELRCFFRQFQQHHKAVPDEYYAHLTGELTREELFAEFPSEAAAASDEALQVELGGEGKGNSPDIVDGRIRKSINGSEMWVLLGGLPCQAYSSMGRRKMIGGMIRKHLNGTNPKVVSSKRLKEAKKRLKRSFRET